jgi:hypothetical protein
MDGIPWQVVTPIATTIVGGLIWLCKKTWTLLEGHAERRTKAVEAIAPSIKAAFEEVSDHVSEKAKVHTEVIEKTERRIIEAVSTGNERVLAAVGLAQRVERVEALVRVKGEPGDEMTLPERPERQQTPVPMPPRSRPGRPGSMPSIT